MALNLGELFGKDSAFGQLLIWQVGAQVVSAVMAPGLSELTQLVNETAPVEPLTPATLADLVVRNYLAVDAATATAKRSGVSPDDFALMVRAAGDAVDTTTLIEGYRRRILGWDTSENGMPSVVDGIREGRLADKWAPLIKALGDIPIGVADAVDAAVEGQISIDQARAIAYENGVSAENFTILYNTRGNPPAPGDLSEMVRRGVIPVKGRGPDVLSFEQGISEGASKDKWIPAYEQLMTVLVPEGRITTLLRVGAITRDTAIGWYRQLGYDQTAAEAFATEASTVKTRADKQLAKGDVTTLYADGAIDAATATGLLGALGYEASEAAEILAIQDMHKAAQVADSAITRIRSYYIARKIDDTATVNALNSLGVPPAQQTRLLSAWQIARTSNVRVLTEAQVADAWAYGIMDAPTAIIELMALGYTEYDAWVVLSIKNKAPLTDTPPAKGPSPITGGST